MGEPIEAVFHLPHRGEVREDADKMGDPSGPVPNGRGGQPFGIDLSALASVPDFPPPPSFFQQGFPHSGVKLRPVATGFQDAGVAAHRFFPRIAGDLGEGGIDVQNCAVHVGDENALLGGLKHLGGGLHPLEFGFSAGDVPKNGDEVGRAACGVPHQGNG